MDEQEKERIKMNLQECIRLLNIDGQNTKKQVKFLLEEILDDFFVDKKD